MNAAKLNVYINFMSINRRGKFFSLQQTLLDPISDWVFVKHVMTHEDPKVQSTSPQRVTIVHDHPTEVKSVFKQLHRMS